MLIDDLSPPLECRHEHKMTLPSQLLLNAMVNTAGIKDEEKHVGCRAKLRVATLCPTARQELLSAISLRRLAGDAQWR